MVRVGGGWQALDEFLMKNDPCRGKFTQMTTKLSPSSLQLINFSRESPNNHLFHSNLQSIHDGLFVTNQTNFLLLMIVS